MPSMVPLTYDTSGPSMFVYASAYNNTDELSSGSRPLGGTAGVWAATSATVRFPARSSSLRR